MSQHKPTADDRKAYPRLVGLSVSIRRGEGVAHVRCSELEAKLGEEKAAKFDDLFGVQTCPYFEDIPGGCVYPWDAEAVLERMASGELTGTQLFWD